MNMSNQLVPAQSVDFFLFVIQLQLGFLICLWTERGPLSFPMVGVFFGIHFCVLISLSISNPVLSNFLRASILLLKIKGFHFWKFPECSLRLRHPCFCVFSVGHSPCLLFYLHPSLSLCTVPLSLCLWLLAILSLFPSPSVSAPVSLPLFVCLPNSFCVSLFLSIPVLSLSLTNQLWHRGRAIPVLRFSRFLFSPS